MLVSRTAFAILPRLARPRPFASGPGTLLHQRHASAQWRLQQSLVFVVFCAWHEECTIRQRFGPNAMSKSSAPLESSSHAANPRPKRTRKARTPIQGTPNPVSLSSKAAGSNAKPLLIGIGIGAALTLTAVALGSRPAKRSYFSARPPTVAGAFAKTASLLLVRMFARKALAIAARQGARKLASAWPL